MRQAFWSSACFAERFIRLDPTGPRGRNLLQLRFQLLCGQLPALQPVTGFDDFFNIEFKNIAAAELTRRPLASAEKQPESPPALAERQSDLLVNFVVLRNRLLGLTRKGGSYGGDVYENNHRPSRQGPA